MNVLQIRIGFPRTGNPHGCGVSEPVELACSTIWGSGVYGARLADTLALCRPELQLPLPPRHLADQLLQGQMLDVAIGNCQGGVAELSLDNV